MPIIYAPRGAALEYAPLAANLYRGCPHGCKYCFVPACLRQKPDVFHAPAGPRPGVLDSLRKESAGLLPGAGPILLSFTSDPYQPLEAETKTTRQALELLGPTGAGLRVLTKNGPLAVRDFDLFEKYGVEFGQTFVFRSETDCRKWEPMAPPTADRLRAFREAQRRGITLWASLEPVIDPAQSLDLLTELCAVADVVKIGKINHDRKLENAVNWPRFLQECYAIISKANHGLGWYFKDALWRAGDGAAAGFPKTNLPKRITP